MLKSLGAIGIVIYAAIVGLIVTLSIVLTVKLIDLAEAATIYLQSITELYGG